MSFTQILFKLTRGGPSAPLFNVTSPQSAKYPSQFVVDTLRLIGYIISKTFWFIRYGGKENIPDRSFGGFLIASNHQTYIDPVWICLPMRRRFRFMAYDKIFDRRFLGPFVSYLGAFPVSMDVGGTLKAMKAALRSLRDGAALTVFPEGAREFADGEMFAFKTGAVRIALQAGVPILPVTISGGNRIWPRGQKYPNLFRRVVITYHPLIHINKREDVDTRGTLDTWTKQLEKMISGSV